MHQPRSFHAPFYAVAALLILLPEHVSQAFSVPPGLVPLGAFRHRIQRGRSRSAESVRFASIVKPSPSDDDDDDDYYAEFLDIKDRRRAIQNCPTFDALGALDIERMVQLMEKVQVDEGARVFKQGDKPDALYFIANGTFDCFEESTGLVKATLKKFDVLGELGLLLNEPRALSVRAASTDASLWRLDRSYFTQIMSRDAMKGAVASLEDQELYSDFLEMRARQEALQSCKIFQTLSPKDVNAVLECMKKIEVDTGDRIIAEGADGDSMYFVEHGTFECYQEKDRKVLKVCEKGSYFGELALFFQTPRRVSVRATSASTVWELTREDFFTAVQETAIDEEALEILRNAYEDQAFINLDEIYQLLVIKSRPKKKSVSLHSSLSSVATGVYIASLLPLLDPHMNGLGGLPSIMGGLLQHLTPSASHQMQLVCWLLAASGVLGLFRFPPRTPPARKRIFELVTTTLLFLAAYGSSSVTGQNPDSWLFDAFSTQGKVILSSFGLLTFISSFRLLDDAIAGSMKGRESIPSADNRLAALAVYSVLFFLTFLDFFLALPIFTSDLPTFETNVRDVLVAGHIDGLTQGVTTTGVGSSAFGSLLATLQFEKKISPLVGCILAVALMVTLNYDGLIVFYNVMTNPDAVAPGISDVVNFFLEQASQMHYFELGTACTAVVVLNAFRKKIAGIENN